MCLCVCVCVCVFYRLSMYRFLSFREAGTFCFD